MVASGEALSSFNVLVNYWWDAFSIGPDAPSAGLLLSMIAIAERPLPERQAWKAFFDHYVFRSNGHPRAHLPPSQHGVLGPLKPDNYGRLRAYIMQLLRGGQLQGLSTITADADESAGLRTRSSAPLADFRASTYH